MRFIPGRRSFLKSIPASLLAAMGLGRAKAAPPTPTLIEGHLSSLRPIEAELGNTAWLQIFSGKPPLPGAPATGTLLCSLPKEFPAEPVEWAARLRGAEGIAEATVIPGYARAVEVGHDGETRVADQFTCGVGGGDIAFSSHVVAGGFVSINKAHIAEPDPDHDPTDCWGDIDDDETWDEY